MADGKDSAVQPMQAARREPIIDLVPSKPERPQLRACDDTVLRLRKRGDRPLACTKGTFARYARAFVPLAPPSRQLRRSPVTGQ
jgi:hypothetical protein